MPKISVKRLNFVINLTPPCHHVITRHLLAFGVDPVSLNEKCVHVVVYCVNVDVDLDDGYIDVYWYFDIVMFLLIMFSLILMFARMETVGFLRMRRVHVSLLAFFGLIVNFMLRFLPFGLIKLL